MSELWLMFSGAFVAATLLPGGSEILLLALIHDTPREWLVLVMAATLGNTLGSISSYYLGSLGRLATTPEALASSRYRHGIALIRRYGCWALLLAWMPLIGDLLCLLAGWMKLPPLNASLMIFIGKCLRYLVIALAALQLL